MSPWVKVDSNYVFDAPHGKVALADLFGGHSQLLIYHFMFGPDWAEGCPSCSFVSDHLDRALPHLAARDVSLVMVSRAPLPKIETFKKRMGWKFPWVSSKGNSFNHDFHVYFTPEEKADAVQTLAARVGGGEHFDDELRSGVNPALLLDQDVDVISQHGAACVSASAPVILARWP